MDAKKVLDIFLLILMIILIVYECYEIKNFK